MKKAKKRTISFRVPEEIAKLLDIKAKEYETTPCSHACYLFIQSLLGESYLQEELRELAEGQQELADGQARQEWNLKTATVALLVDGGKANVTEAEGFVRERFRKAGRIESRGDER